MLKLQHNLKLFLLKMKAARGNDAAEQVIRQAKEILARLVTVCYAQLLISILTHSGYPMKKTE
jgi:ribosomal protein L29